MDNDKTYELLQELKQDIAVIKTEITQIKCVVPKVDEINIKLIEHETSITQLERTNNRMWIVISGVIVGLAVAILKSFLGV